MPVAQRRDPGVRGFGRIARTDDRQVWDGPQCRQMFHSLMSGAVLSEEDAVMCKDIDHREMHKRAQAHGGAAVIRKHQERGAINDEPPMQCHSVHDCGHAVFTNAEMQIAAGHLVCLNRIKAF